jgi:hypothetical protein
LVDFVGLRYGMLMHRRSLLLLPPQIGILPQGLSALPLLMLKFSSHSAAAS